MTAVVNRSRFFVSVRRFRASYRRHRLARLLCVQGGLRAWGMQGQRNAPMSDTQPNPETPPPSVEDILAAADAEAEKQLLADLSPAEREVLSSFAAQIGADFRLAVETTGQLLADMDRRLNDALDALGQDRLSPGVEEMAQDLRAHLQLPQPTRLSERLASLSKYLMGRYGWTPETISRLTAKQKVDRVSLDIERVCRAVQNECDRRPPPGKQVGVTARQEWIPATEAVERAERTGYTITQAWLSRLPKAAQAQVGTRPREQPGNHKLEVEWNSLAGYLTRTGPPQKPPEVEDREGEDDQEGINRRMEEEREKKRRERSPD
jgi:hypothetical protein